MSSIRLLFLSLNPKCSERLRDLGLCQISSAVSTVLRTRKFVLGGAVGAEQCGYGDLR
jgi:hypothetical protein